METKIDSSGGGITTSGEGDAYCPFSKVFSIDLLREIILEHAIKKVEKTDGNHPEGQLHNYSIKAISCFRLVSKSFLQTISSILKKRDVGLKEVELWYSDSTSKIEGESYQWKESLGKVVGLFSSPDHLDQLSVLPFALDGLFIEQHLQILEDCFTHCSRNLTSLNFIMSLNVRIPTMPSHRNLTISFPCLQNFEIFWSHKLFGPEVNDNQTNGNIFTFVQTILDGTEKLKTFLLSSAGDNRGDRLAPDSIKNLRLPKTLSELHILGKHLNLLVLNNLPKLNHLTIDLTCDVSSIRVTLASEILEKYRKTLTFFKLTNYRGLSEREPNDIQFVKLPVMEQLKTLKIQASHCGFRPSLSGLEKCLPNLENMEVIYTSVEIWLELLRQSKKFASVKNLNLSVFNSEEVEIDGVVHRPGKRYIRLDEKQLRMTRSTFPNLQSLEIDMDAHRLPILLRELRHLKKLKLDACFSFCAYEWTEAILGITREEVDRLKLCCGASQEYPWNEIEVNREDNVVSLLNLTELTSFELFHPGLFMGLDELSCMLFYLGFMKMSSLSDLKMDCHFNLTPEMMQEWNEMRHGKMDCSNSEFPDWSSSDEEDSDDEGDDLDSDDWEDILGSDSEYGEDSVASDEADDVVRPDYEKDLVASDEVDHIARHDYEKGFVVSDDEDNVRGCFSCLVSCVSFF